MKKILTLCIASMSLVTGFTYAAASQVQKGDIIAVDYTLTMPDKSVADTTNEALAKKAKIYSDDRVYSPFIFKVGEGQVIKGFDKAVVGMKIGETKNVRVSPDEAYGESDPTRINTLDISIFSAGNIVPKVWESYTVMGRVVKVTSIKGNNVTVDGNHPMAGKPLVFTITVKNIEMELPEYLTWLPQWTLTPAQMRTMFAGAFREWNTKGNIALVEYSDPACPFCTKHFQNKTVENLLKDYPSAEYTYKPVMWVNHPTTKYKSNAILCAGKVWWVSAYKAMYSLILGQATDSSTVNSDITAYVKKNLDETKWNTCVKKNQMIMQYNATMKELKTLVKTPGTPSTLVLNKKTGQWLMIQGAYPLENFKQVIDFMSK